MDHTGIKDEFSYLRTSISDLHVLYRNFFQIYYIFEVQNILYRKIIPYFTNKCCGRSLFTREIMLKASDEHFREFRAKDKAIKDDIKV